MAIVHKLIDAATTTETSSVVSPQQNRDEGGVFMVHAGGTTTSFTCKIQGRMEPTGAWFDIETLDQTDIDTNDSAASVIQTFPQMRIDLTAVAGGAPAITAWLHE